MGRCKYLTSMLHQGRMRGGFYVRTSIPSRTSEMHLVVRLGQTGLYYYENKSFNASLMLG